MKGRGTSRTVLPLKCRFELIGEEGTTLSLKGKMLKVVPTVLMFKGARGEAAGKTCWIDRCLVAV